MTSAELARRFKLSRATDRQLRLFATACLRVAARERQQEARWRHFMLSVNELEKLADGSPADVKLINVYLNPDWDSQTVAVWAATGVPENRHLADDILGRSPRPSIDPIWLTPTVVSLAYAAYDERNWRACWQPCPNCFDSQTQSIAACVGCQKAKAVG